MRTPTAIAALLLALAAPAAAQQVDARWAPWVGCWQLVDGKAEVCIAPASPAGVTLRTRVAGQAALEQTIVADGAPHALTEAGCTGSQRAEWSRHGHRLFTRAEVTCSGQAARSISGLALITPDQTWLDVQAVEIADRTGVRVLRYRRVTGGAATSSPAMAQPAAPYVGGAAFTLEDVKEASAKVSPTVLEAVLAETDARWPSLRSRDLIALDDAGVPDSVIDLIVAQSYPQKFQVERRQDVSLGMYPPPFADAAWSGSWGLGYPYYSWDAGYYGNYPYYYSPFGYGYSGYYGPSFYYYPGVVIGGSDTPGTTPQDGDGRVVNGIGYTRVRTREAAPVETDGGSSASSSGRSTIRSSGYTQSGSGSSGSSSGSSGGASSGGASPSGGSDGGRTAQPR